MEDFHKCVARGVPDNLRSAVTTPEEDTHAEQEMGMGTVFPPDANSDSGSVDTDRETGGLTVEMWSLIHCLWNHRPTRS